MGQKGAKLTSEVTVVADTLVETLSNLGEVSSRRMFGGCGIFESGTMFALVDSGGTPHLKVDATNIAKFREASSHQHGKMPYYSIPEKVLSNKRSLRAWAKESLRISKAAK